MTREEAERILSRRGTEDQVRALLRDAEDNLGETKRHKTPKGTMCAYARRILGGVEYTAWIERL